MPPPGGSRRLGTMRNRDGNIIDRGFNNIGVRPTADDLGVGASDAFGPLSHTRRVFPGAFPPDFGGAGERKASASKAPSRSRLCGMSR